VFDSIDAATAHHFGESTREAAVRIVISPLSNNKSEFQKRYQTIQLLINEVQKRCAKEDDQTLLELVKSFLDIKNSQGDTTIHFQAINAAKFLICQKIYALQKNNKNQIVIIPWVKRLMDACIQSGDLYSSEKNDKDAARNYKYACNIADVFDLLEQEQGKQAINKLRECTGLVYSKGAYNVSTKTSAAELKALLQLVKTSTLNQGSSSSVTTLDTNLFKVAMNNNNNSNNNNKNNSNNNANDQNKSSRRSSTS
jgi:hypothetical protein